MKQTQEITLIAAQIAERAADRINRNFDRAQYKKDWVKSIILFAIEKGIQEFICQSEEQPK